MYLKGSKWSLQRRKKRSHPVRVFFLAVLVAGMFYINQFVVPTVPPLFIPTPTPTRSPDSYLVEAQQLIGEGKITQAIAAYQEAAKVDPRNPSIYVTLARWQVFFRDYEGAAENIQNALLLNPNHALAKAVQGWILAKQDDYLAAEAALREALELDPNSALAYAYRAELYIDMLNADKGDANTQSRAIADSQEARRLDPDLLEVHRVRGLILEVTGQFQEAIPEYKAAIQQNENLADLHVALGRTYRKAGEYALAVEELNQAIALRPDDPEPYTEMASTYLTWGEFTKGAQIAEQAVQRNPADPFVQGLLGTMYFKLGSYGEAVYPLRLAVRGGQAFTLDADGNQVAVEVQGIPLSRDLLYAMPYYSRYGIALAHVGQSGEALQIAQQLLQVYPGDPDVEYNVDLIIETCENQEVNPSPENPEG